MMAAFTMYFCVWVVLALWLARRQRKWWIFPLVVIFGPALGLLVLFAVACGGMSRSISTGPQPLGYRTRDNGRTYRPFY